MGYLARRRDTHTIRLLLLPTILVVVIHGTYGYGGFNREYAFYTWLRGLAGLSTIAMTLDFTFTHEGRLKIGESSLTPINEQSPPPSPVSSESSTSSNVPPHESVAERSLPPWALDTLEVCSTLRGIGLERLRQGRIIVPHPRNPPFTTLTHFMRTSIISFIKNYLILDLCLVVFKSFPGIGTPLGGSIYLSGLPLFHRHTVALLLSIFSGFTLISGFNVLNGAATLAGVGLLRAVPLPNGPRSSIIPGAADSPTRFLDKASGTKPLTKNVLGPRRLLLVNALLANLG
ncbi:hypothetical protein NLI96_g6872 [Meripilus lineatus]|uniref:Uncharacterized protein n=1 Tax=Meripilus lineatus TaxID=2056292 RepID=A0AAD5YHQ4_9APHY|nr:hypothetical protein NLI96_g6872 [Physisporinus lineatus]